MLVPFSISMALLSSSCRATSASIRGPLEGAVSTEDVTQRAESDANSPHRELLSISPRVIGGRTAPANRYTYTVSLQSNGVHFCGGVLVAVDAVLTAAHCIYQIPNNSSPITVVIGRQNLSVVTEGEELEVIEAMVHPNYLQSVENDNDFALLFMSRPTMSKVDLIKVNSVNSKPRKYQSVLVLGWGETSVGEYRQVSDLLNEASLRIIPNSLCNTVEGDWNGIHVTYDGYISESMVCASFKNRDSCQGDSGGPLIVKGDDGSSDLLVGLVSWGVGCANDWPGVYARVSSGYNWIRREACWRSVFPPEHFDCEPF